MKHKQHSGAEELIRIATEEVEKPPAVPPREHPSPLQRRAHRLIPEQKPITWTDALEKYNPL